MKRRINILIYPPEFLDTIQIGVFLFIMVFDPNIHQFELDQENPAELNHNI